MGMMICRHYRRDNETEITRQADVTHASTQADDAGAVELSIKNDAPASPVQPRRGRHKKTEEGAVEA